MHIKMDWILNFSSISESLEPESFLRTTFTLFVTTEQVTDCHLSKLVDLNTIIHLEKG